MAYEKLRYAVSDGIATITLSDPATLNAASTEMAVELLAALRAAVKDARAIVLTGEGRGFCSGANLSSVGEARGAGPVDAGSALDTTFNPLIAAMRDLDIPLVTAVNGVAAGIGCSIALMGDFIVAGESAYFLQAFRRIGLVPDGGSSFILPRMIGRARAMEMMLFGEKVPAAKAESWGMINRVTPDGEVMATALAAAKELANGPKALGLIRRMVWDSLDNGMRDQLAVERRTQTVAGYTQDFIEGVTAFLQKRPARFQGK